MFLQGTRKKKVCLKPEEYNTFSFLIDILLLSEDRSLRGTGSQRSQSCDLRSTDDSGLGVLEARHAMLRRGVVQKNLVGIERASFA